MTRALIALGQLEWSAAVSANPAAPCLVVAALAAVVRPNLLRSEQRDRLAGVALIALTVVWLLRTDGPAAAIAF